MNANETTMNANETTMDVNQAEADMQAKRAAKKAAQKAKKDKPTGKSANKPGSKSKAAKAPAKKAVAKTNGANPERLIPANLEAYVKDNEHKTAGGNVSVHCGDEVAQKLVGKSLDQVYAMAARACKVDEKELRAKYKGLNPGMQRMNLGNRIRGAAAQAAGA